MTNGFAVLEDAPGGVDAVEGLAVAAAVGGVAAAGGEVWAAGGEMLAEGATGAAAAPGRANGYGMPPSPGNPGIGSPPGPRLATAVAGCLA